MKATQSTFVGLEINQDMQGLRGEKTVQTLWESLLNLYGLENSKPTANPGRRSTVMELASAIPLGGHDYSNFRTAVGKLVFMAPWTPDNPTTIHTSRQSHNRGHVRSETVDTKSQRHATHQSSS